jgi:hypothetical protein
LGATVFVLGLYATTPRALRSAERLAPLIAGESRQHADAHA